MKRFVSWMSGRRLSVDDEDEATNLPRGVQRVYMMEKDAGHRGPIVGAFLVDVFSNNNDQVVVIVTPSGVSVMTKEDGKSIAYRRPESGDAFTACCLISISTKIKNDEIITKNCGLVLGTQQGRLELLEVSSTDLKVLHQCSEKTSSISTIERIRFVPSVVAVGTLDGRLLLWDPVVHPFTPTVSIKVVDEGGASPGIQSITNVGESELWLSTVSNSLHIFSVAVDTFAKVRTLTCSPAGSVELGIPIFDMAESRSQNIVICLSTDIVLVDVNTKTVLLTYPARLMSCGAAVTSLNAFDDDESTFIILGGVEGSLCVRELNRRRSDNKLQCVLLRCFDKLVPEKNDSVNIPEGCPVSSLSIASGDLCIVGDAACSVFVINMSLHQWRSTTTEEPDEEDDVESKQETREPSSEETTEPQVARQQSLELPIEARRQIPDQKIEEPVDDETSPVDESPKITVVSPLSKISESSKSIRANDSPKSVTSNIDTQNSAEEQNMSLEADGVEAPAGDEPLEESTPRANQADIPKEEEKVEESPKSSLSSPRELDEDFTQEDIGSPQKQSEL